MNRDRLIEMVEETVIIPMKEYLEDILEDGGEADFTTEDIEKCGDILYEYLNGLDKIPEPTDDLIMEEVKKAVLALNDLNESVDYSLIETMEREAICEVLQSGALVYGLKDIAEDITEEWREW